MRLVRVDPGGPDEAELCVDEHGDPDAPLVLLVHGAAASYDFWDLGLCEALAAGGRRVVRYDHRDTGRSTTGTPGRPDYDAGTLLRDLAALVEALGAPAHLVGVSMGGGLAQTLALRRPELVASLTLVATAAAGGVDDEGLPGPAPALAAYFADPPADPDWSDRAAVVAWFLATERVFAGPGFDEARSRASVESMLGRSHDPAAAGNHWLVVGGDDGPPLDVHEITVPTLVVHGSADPMFPPPHAEALAAAVPDARLLVVDGMGHQVPPPGAWPELVAGVLALGG